VPRPATRHRPAHPHLSAQRSARWLLAGLLLLAGTAAGAAQTVAEPVPDLQRLCLECHQGDSDRVQAPLLEGQQHDYLARQLRQFQQRHRDSFPMSSIVAGMSAAELDDLARRLAQQPWPSRPQAVNATAVARGADLARQAGCGQCHGTDLAGGSDGPRLAGQHAGYLQRQLAAFLDGRRQHPDRADGQPWLAKSSAQDLSALSQYLHAAGRTGQP